MPLKPGPDEGLPVGRVYDGSAHVKSTNADPYSGPAERFFKPGRYRLTQIKQVKTKDWSRVLDSIGTGAGASKLPLSGTRDTSLP
jgi:hypothetical protein